MARAGARVLLLETQFLPRYKPCGGGLTAKTVREIPFDLGPVIEDVCYGFEVTFRRGGRFVRRYPEPLDYTVMRGHFDRYLSDQATSAGTMPMEVARATGEVPNGTRVRVRAERGIFQVGALMGAGGASRILARSMA